MSVASDVQNSIVVKIDDIKPLTNKGGEIRVVISPKTVQSRRLIMGTALLKAGESIIEHVHDYGEEAIIVLRGKGVIVVDDESHSLNPGYAAIVPQGSRHVIRNNGIEELEIAFATAPLAPTASAGDRIT